MHDYLPGFIKQFDAEEGELIAENWTVVEFLRWLELNKFILIKNTDIVNVQEDNNYLKFPNL